MTSCVLRNALYILRKRSGILLSTVRITIHFKAGFPKPESTHFSLIRNHCLSQKSLSTKMSEDSSSANDVKDEESDNQKEVSPPADKKKQSKNAVKRKEEVDSKQQEKIKSGDSSSGKDEKRQERNGKNKTDKTANSKDATRKAEKRKQDAEIKSKQAKKAKVEKKEKSQDSESASEKEESKDTVDDKDGDFLQKIFKRRQKVCENVSKFKFNKNRVKVLSETQDFLEDSNGVLYWMSRDQRIQDNWAFLYAQRLAMKLEVPLHVCFCLVPKFLEATIRQFGFMMKGLALVEKECKDLNIPFHLVLGEASKSIPAFLKEHNIGGVVTDFSPLRVPMKWVDDLKKALPKDIPFCQVDAHNIVPCWEASPKLEYGARTIRSKINKQLGEYLTEFPPLVKHPHAPKEMPKETDWVKADSSLEIDRSVKEVAWAQPGTEAGLRMLESFCEKRLKYFGTDRNDPNKQALSNLSPWFHFGQISVQRCILTVRLYRSKASESVNAFIEEAVVRRELADNFCFYNPDYDAIKGTNDWAKKSLDLHRKDKRPYLYSREQLENNKTHDDLWNAAQIQLVTEGKMHGFLRMYWAKKILEWTKSPEDALADAIYLNDKYNLDGRDPNGYVGCMWSICGIHDQGWAERAVFGKIRYMNYQGCKRKFDVAAFARKYSKKSLNK